MPNLLKFSPLLLAVAALLVFQGQTIADQPVNDEEEISLEGANLGSHVHGPEIDADAISGKVVVFKYWGDRCGPCLRAIPHTNEVQAEYGRDKLIIVANQVWTRDADTARAAWQKAGGKDEVTVVNHGAIPNVRVRGVPHAFVFNGDGTLAWRGHPASPQFDEAVETAVAALGDSQN
ncbi:MAG: TlpA disulfide reductase family protein [Planctomycetota bacterium]